MVRNQQKAPVLFYLDDGYPEAREYEANYVALEHDAPKSWWHRFLAKRARAKESTSLTTERVVPRDSRRAHA